MINLIIYTRVNESEERIELGPYGSFPTSSTREAWMREFMRQLDDLNSKLGLAPKTIDVMWAGAGQFRDEDVVPPPKVEQVIAHLRGIYLDLVVRTAD